MRHTCAIGQYMSCTHAVVGHFAELTGFKNVQLLAELSLKFCHY